MLATLLRWLFLGTLTGVIVGTGASLFLQALFFMIDYMATDQLGLQILFLPLAGLLNGLLIFYGYHKHETASDSIILAVNRNKGRLPLKTIWIKPIASIVTLSLGGSAGKEGPASHIGGSLASGLGRVLRLSPPLQQKIVACGVSAGFASVFGTPLAGAIYAIEILSVGRIRHDYLFAAIISGITSFEVSKFLGLTYDIYPQIQIHDFSEVLFLKVILIGIICGIAAWIFVLMFEEIRIFFNYLQHRFHIWRPLLPMIGGFILAALIIFLPSDYLGLSLPIMDEALRGGSIPFLAFFWKSLFVAITLGSGFYGGIVTPQFVIGALCGNVFAGLLGIDPILGATVGMLAVVAAASNAPIAAVLMGFELFDASIGLYMTGACLAAYIIIGHHSVYPDQLIAFKKSIWMRSKTGARLGDHDVQISYRVLRKINKWQRKEVKKHHSKKID